MTTSATEPYNVSTSGVPALTAVNHKTIGLRWIVTAFAFFVAAGLLALTMVTQLSRADQGLLSAETYNQFFTMHGITMMFYFAVPIMLGLGLYFVPLMIGAREVAFPRLNAFSFWLFLFGGLLLYYSFLAGGAPA